jgi:hypothetical protein
MSFEEERLAILQRVSNGELSPQEGQLEIAMLKVKHQQGQEPGLQASASGRDGHGAEHQQPFRPPFAMSGPLAFALALPFVLIGGVMLVGLSLFLALPTWVIVFMWNQAAATHPGWPVLAFWPTLGALVLTFTVITVLNWGRRLRALVQNATVTRPFGEQ